MKKANCQTERQDRQNRFSLENWRS